MDTSSNTLGKAESVEFITVRSGILQSFGSAIRKQSLSEFIFNFLPLPLLFCFVFLFFTRFWREKRSIKFVLQDTNARCQLSCPFSVLYVSDGKYNVPFASSDAE